MKLKMFTNMFRKTISDLKIDHNLKADLLRVAKNHFFRRIRMLKNEDPFIFGRDLRQEFIITTGVNPEDII